MNKKEIPLMFCFDNNYVIPAAVAFYSLLEHANREYYYKLYILHTDISLRNQEKLKENVKEFSDFSELIFVDMENKFKDLWVTISTKGHFSKEVMYKILVANIFPIYDKIIVSDVDVVFLNDISESFFEIDASEDYYLAGTKIIGKMKWYMDQYLQWFSKEEVEKLSGFCGGYIVFNLKKLREDHMEEKFIRCFETEGHRINQMEQDVLNLCCYPKTKKLPLKYVACSYMWDEYKTEKDKETDIYYTKEEIEDAMNNTVQLHYATSTKPWKNVNCTKSEVWFKYLIKTNFLREYLEKLPYQIVLPEGRINEIEQKNKEKIEEIVRNEIMEEVKKSCTIKSRINRKFEKYRLFRIIKYIIKNPLFLIKKSFYRKIKEKIKHRIDKKDFTLVIFDDIFPSVYSPFRYEEYLEYLKTFERVYIYTTGISLPTLNEKRNVKEVIEEFENKFPQYKGKTLKLNYENKEKLKDFRNKIAITTFLQNTRNNLELIEKYQIPFIFTLYPGGGFILDNKESDAKLKEIFSSKYFRKVIVTQKITYEYLLQKQFCREEDIEFIYGIVTPESILQANPSNKLYYKNGKETLDLCFVAHKYCEKGIDKGYDLFIEVAKKLSEKYNNIKFHIVGEFDENEIDVTDIKNNIEFYGIQTSEELINIYRNIDIILSPNRPFQLSKGSFDGFPTGSCTEAMINKVALMCSDELKLNTKFEDGKEIIIIKTDTGDIIKKIESLYKKPSKIIEISNNGREKALEVYSKNNQILPRIQTIKKEAKKYYKY